MQSTRAIAITALIASFAALFFAVTDFPGAGDSSATNPAAILLPAQTLAARLNDPGDRLADVIVDFWLGQEALGYEYYTHPATGLTFPYHKDFRLMIVKEDGGEVILAENAEHAMAFQIFIQPFDEPGPLTVERIRRDLPDMQMEAVSETTTYKSDDPMLTFLSMDKTLGPIPQAWFIRDGYLYQLSMYAPVDDENDPLSLVWFRGFLQHITFTSPS
jgi:hypothetical protein